MSDYLVLVDIAAKQEYIFSSNKLKDMVGASEIIARATDVDEIKKLNLAKFSESSFSGGGNAYLFFENKKIALEFIEKYSLHLLKTYPSLMPYLVPYEMSGGYQEDIRKAKAKLDEIRNSFYPLTHSLNIGFERLCPSSNIGVNDGGEISNATASKRKMVENAKRFNRYLEGKGYEFSSELDDIYIHNNAFISVVHCDINALGEKVKKLGSKEESKEFSKHIDEIMQEAFGQMIDKLIELIKSKPVFAGGIEYKLKKANVLPIRPIILNGDDFTFVSEGRLGVWLSKVFIKELEKVSIKYFDSLYASAGIAICKAKTPFSRAYQLSEELASKAKALARKNKDKDKTDNKSTLSFLILSNQVKSGLNYLENIYTSERISGENKYINAEGYVINDNNNFKEYELNRLLKLINILNKMARSKMMKIRDLLFYENDDNLTKYIDIYCENEAFKKDELLDGNNIKNEYQNMLLDAIELSAFYPQKESK